MKKIKALALTIGLTFALGMLAIAGGPSGNAPKPVVGFRVLQCANTCFPVSSGCGFTVLDNPAINGNPDAVFVVTPINLDPTVGFTLRYDQTGNCSTVGPGHWVIDEPSGNSDAYNVLALK